MTPNQNILSSFLSRQPYKAWMVIGCLLAGCSFADIGYAQGGGDSPAAASSGGALGEDFFRIGVLDVTSMRYNQPHPFEQMTGRGKFKAPASNSENSLEWTSRVPGQNETRTSDKIMHALPPFSIEYVFPTDYFFMYGFSIKYNHTATYLDDSIASGARSVSSTTPIIVMKTYYDLIGINFHPFTDPSQEGVDFNFGIGTGKVDGVYQAGFRAQADNNYRRSTVLRTFEKAPFFFRHVALDLNGSTFGLRLAMFMITRAVYITDNYFYKNTLTPDALSSIDFSGIMLQVGMTIRF